MTEPGDEGGFVKMVLRMIEDANLRKSLAEAARKVVEEKLDARKTVEVMEAFYEGAGRNEDRS